ncbi:MAG: hypothetical protein ACI848_000695 [Roseivirga sp.]|jgi:hypothetical protein
MFLINAHAKPTKESDQYDKVIGAYISIYLNYTDIDGAFELAKYYIEEEGWVLDDVEDEYYTINSKSELEDDEQELYDECLEYGFSMIFNCYESEEE